MRKSALHRFWILSLLLLLPLIGCSSGPKLPPLTQEGVVLAFGDSITYGTGAGAEESYPAVLGRLISRRVVNAGIPGEISGDGLARLPLLLDQEKPSLVIICHGANDMLRGMDMKVAADNLRAMVSLAKERGASVVLIAVPALGYGLSPIPFYGEVAREAGVPCQEQLLSEILSRRSLKADFVHPNAAGYRMMAESLAALLKQSGALP